MPRVALVTTDLDRVGQDDPDLPILLAELPQRGLVADDPRWDDESVDWSRFDLILMRSPWNYPERLEVFLAWIEAARRVAPVLNCPDLIRWNLDKAYIPELGEEGVPVVETRLCDSLEAVRDAISGLGADQVVVKPNVSAGSRDTGRFERGDEAAVALAETILGRGRRAMVQPCIETVGDHGEVALLYFDGRLSHSIRKGPILELGGGLIGGTYTEVITAVEPTAEEVAVAEAAMAAITRVVGRHGCTCADPTPLYARLDLVQGRSGPELLEAELFEPSYFLESAPGSERTFGDAVIRRLEAAGHSAGAEAGSGTGI